MDLIDKKARILKRNDFQVMLKETQCIYGIIKHRSLNESQKGKKEEMNTILTTVDFKGGAKTRDSFRIFDEKLIRTLIELKIRMKNTWALSMLCYLAIDHGWECKK